MQHAVTDLRRGVMWSLVSAFWVALFIVPWKLAAEVGSGRINVLLLVISAAVFNSVPAGKASRASVAAPLTGFRLWWLAIRLALCTLLGNWLSAQAVARVSPPVFSVVLRSEALWVALLGLIFLREAVDRLFWVGLLALGAGLWLLQDAPAGVTATTEGVLYGVAAASSFAVMAVLVRKHIAGINPRQLNALRLWCAVGCWFLMNGFPAELSTISWPLMGYVALAALFGPTLSRLCVMMSARYVPAWLTSLVSQTSPVFTLLLTLLWGAGLPSERELWGGILVLSGVVLPLLPKAKGAWSRSFPT